MKIEYEKNPELDALTYRISRVLDGEDLVDVALACVLIAAYSIATGVKPEDRAEVMEMAIAFMRDSLAKIAEEEASPSNHGAME